MEYVADSLGFRVSDSRLPVAPVYEGVAPVLNSCGRTLKTLVLEQFTEMDPAFIGKSCPGLTHLALSCCDTYAPCMIIITILMVAT